MKRVGGHIIRKRNSTLLLLLWVIAIGLILNIVFYYRTNLIAPLTITSYYHDSYSEKASTEITWRSILKPCEGKTAWSRRVKDKSKRTNVSLSEFSLTFNGLSGRAEIVINTYDSNGEKKQAGGDSWMIRVNGAASMYVQMRDNNDGSYHTYFELPEVGTYKVVAILEFSLCDGLRDPPPWWFTNGTQHGKYQTALLNDDDAYTQETKTLTLDHKHPTKPTGLNTQKHNCENLNKPGYWKLQNNQFKYVLYEQEKISSKQPKKYTAFWVYGDSVSAVFSKYVKYTVCSYFEFCHVTYTWLYPLGIGIPYKSYKHKEFDSKLILSKLKDLLSKKMMATKRSVFLINIGLHAISCLTFKQLTLLFTDIVKMIKTLKKTQELPQIIWKNTTPSFRNVNKETLRFLTKHRIMLWNAFVKEVACKEGIPVLNVHDIGAAYPNGTLDGIHFKNGTFESAAQSLVNHLVKGFN
ncbi:uncharacterized protein LOC130657406 [Hydractinia symbiolongicarpus]|uniref:uncharacterized protein LOC130657406 n=1 Tax=Hydractinia symbiolongicarpus TaxID=13093 RepID=UPI00254C8F6D|nr:uncharacterized protein LOC130657406 [Hydractinia symbiolongicarpus]